MPHTPKAEPHVQSFMGDSSFFSRESFCWFVLGLLELCLHEGVVLFSMVSSKYLLVCALKQPFHRYCAPRLPPHPHTVARSPVILPRTCELLQDPYLAIGALAQHLQELELGRVSLLCALLHMVADVDFCHHSLFLQDQESVRKMAGVGGWGCSMGRVDWVSDPNSSQSAL